MLTLPQKVRRKKQSYLAIRSQLHKRHIYRQGILFHSELLAFLDARGITGYGPAFSRYLSIDRDGEMEIEFGVFTDRSYAGSGPVRSGQLPAGNYLTVLWTGLFDKLYDVAPMLNGWAEKNGVLYDGSARPNGVAYGCRIEIYHPAPSGEPDPAKWQTEIAILMKGQLDPDP